MMDRAEEVQLNRVGAKLEDLIIEWCESKGVGHRFHLGEFTRDILNQTLCSPTSPYRILALLRSRGVIDYVVVNRAMSQYRLTAVGEEITIEDLEKTSWI